MILVVGLVPQWGLWVRNNGYLSWRSTYSFCGHHCLEFMASKKLVGGGERCASLDKRSSRGLLANRIIFDNLSIGRRTVAITKRHQLWAVKTMISTWTDVVGCDVKPRVIVDKTT